MRLRTVRSLALGVLLLCAATTFATKPLGQASAGSVRRDQLLADLKTLSADDMEGRLVGSPGGAKAQPALR